MATSKEIGMNATVMAVFIRTGLQKEHENQHCRLFPVNNIVLLSRADAAGIRA